MWTDLRRHTPTPRRGSAGQERHLAAVSAVAHHLAVQRAPSDNLVGLGWTHLGSSVPAWGNLEKLQERILIPYQFLPVICIPPITRHLLHLG